MKKFSTILFCSLAFLTVTISQKVENWRGPGRVGIYRETALLKEWPAGGPLMTWAYEQLGIGFSSPVVANGKIYVTGEENDKGHLYILSLEGTLINKFGYGPEFHGQGYPGSRSTPAVAGDMVYVVSSMGLLVCMNATNGKIIWSRDLFNDFDGSNIRWGLTENLLIDGDRIFCTPGGKKHNIVALNRHNGDIIWSSQGAGELSAYCSPLLVNHYGRQLLITHLENHIVAVNADTGRLLWKYKHENRWNVHPNTPIYHEGSIFAFSGYGRGGVKLRLDPAGNIAEVEWTNSDLDNQMGGAVLIDGYIYGSGHSNRFWFSVNWQTGETMYRSREIAKGTVIFADGRIYCYTERGELALVEPSPGSFNIISQAKITLGSNQHWAHPVIENDVLYVRRGNALIAYDIGR